MAIIVNKSDTRTKLQKRISEDLADKAKKKSAEIDKVLPDGVEDSAYLRGTKQTTGLMWVWFFIAFVVAAILVYLVVA